MNEQPNLSKLGIENLNAMQFATRDAVNQHGKVVLLSPTGSGKTLAYLLPLLALTDASLQKTQLLIIAPVRELAQQIHEVIRSLATGLHVKALYGGRTVSYEKQNLKAVPQVVVGTPGRIIDHFERQNIDPFTIKMIVLDEYDKCLEIGFEDQINTIFEFLPSIEKSVLTSATELKMLPQFLRSGKKPHQLQFLEEQKPVFTTTLVKSMAKDKLETLSRLLLHVQDGKGIVFCNFKESINRIGDHLKVSGILHTEYHGGMEQKDREIALIQFRNGSSRILLSTDLAARGLDLPDVDFIIHYHLPLKEDEFTHRNGRTARMMRDGHIYVIHWMEEPLPGFVAYDEALDAANLKNNIQYKDNEWVTVRISAGRKDKVSKGDIVGFLCRKSNITTQDISHLELKEQLSYVGIRKNKIREVLHSCDNQKLKEKNVRVNLIG